MTCCPFLKFSPYWHMLREIHPIGQGSFYTETFKEACYEHCVVAYDCGGTIAGITSLQYTGLEQYVKSAKSVDILFVSHFHEDHINGIKYLIQNNPRIEIYIPKVSPQRLLIDFVYNLYKTNGNSQANDFIINWAIPAILTENGMYKSEAGTEVVVVTCDKTVQIKDRKGKDIWEYDLFWNNGDENVDNNLLKDICEALDISGKIVYGRNLFLKISEIFIEPDVMLKIKSIFNNYNQGGHNAYSMIVHSHPSANATLLDCMAQDATCLYTGDAPVSGRLLSIAQSHKSDCIQVPHHGSKHNYSCNLYSAGQKPFISFGEGNMYNHPGKYELGQIANTCKNVLLVTEDPQTKWATGVSFIV